MSAATELASMGLCVSLPEQGLRPGGAARAAAWTLAWTMVLVMSIGVLDSCKQDRPLREVTLGLSWVHQAQFCGPYYADQHGLYAHEGLRVTLVPAAANLDPMDEFIAGKYDFVIAQPDSLIIARENGYHIKAVAATYRLHPLVYLSLPGSGIETPQDFRGKTIGVAYGGRVPLLAMLKKLGIDPREIRMVQRTYGYDGLLRGDYDVEAGWRTNELIRARRAGLALNSISPYDYGISFYADVLAVRESLIEQEPELVAKFVRATMRGWKHALEDPAASARLPLHYDPHLDPEHEHAALAASAPLVHTGADQIGWMRPADWDAMIAMLYEEGLITARPGAAELFTTQFLEVIPPP